MPILTMRQNKARGIKMIDKDKTVELYKSGKSLRQVGEIMGCSLERVRQILKIKGVKTRPQHITRHASNYTGLKNDSR